MTTSNATGSVDNTAAQPGYFQSTADGVLQAGACTAFATSGTSLYTDYGSATTSFLSDGSNACPMASIPFAVNITVETSLTGSASLDSASFNFDQTGQVAGTPEPGSLLLLATGLLGIGRPAPQKIKLSLHIDMPHRISRGAFF